MTSSSGFTQHIDKEEWTGQVIEVVPIRVDTDVSDSDRTTPASGDHTAQSDNVQSKEASDVNTRQ